MKLIVLINLLVLSGAITPPILIDTTDNTKNTIENKVSKNQGLMYWLILEISRYFVTP